MLIRVFNIRFSLCCPDHGAESVTQRSADNCLRKNSGTNRRQTRSNRTGAIRFDRRLSETSDKRLGFQVDSWPGASAGTFCRAHGLRFLDLDRILYFAALASGTGLAYIRGNT